MTKRQKAIQKALASIKLDGLNVSTNCLKSKIYESESSIKILIKNGGNNNGRRI